MERHQTGTVFDINYDIVLPIGAGCPTAMALSHHAMRFSSFPFDWLRVGSINEQSAILAGRFKDFFNLKDLKISKTETNEHHLVVDNTRWGYASCHDFPKGETLEASHPGISSKLDRRIHRLVSQLDAGCNVMLLWVDYPFEQAELPVDELQKALAKIQQAYPNSTFSLLYIHNQEGLTYSNRIEKHVTPHICQISIAYNAHKVDHPWLIKYEELSFLLSRIHISPSPDKDKQTYKRYTAMKSNFGNSEQVYLRRHRFAQNFASLILNKRSVWKISKIIYELMKH